MQAARSWSVWISLIGLSLLLVFLAGCGGGGGRNTVRVSGEVTLDGSPLDGASVMFTGPEGGTPVTAVTDASGKFQIDAVPGLNKVAVSKTESAAGGSGDDLSPPDLGVAGARPPAGPKQLVPVRYVNPTTSGLTVEVKPGMEPVKLELSSR